LVRIQYSAKAAGIANGWKKWIGENKGIERTGIITKKKDKEGAFKAWVHISGHTENPYYGLIDAFEELYGNISPLERELTLLSESAFGIEILRFARQFQGLVKKSDTKEKDEAEIETEIDKLRRYAASYFKNYHMPLDKETFIAMISAYLDMVNPEYIPDELDVLNSKFESDIQAYADYVFDESIFTSEESVNAFLDNYKAKKYKKILNDPAYDLASGFADMYNKEIRPQLSKYWVENDSLQRLYMKGQMTFRPQDRYYPDANFTLRVTYGKVKGYEPRDAVTYEYYTTLEGIMQKEDPAIYDYVVEDKLKELYENKDYGRYADKDGNMHVCFIATNHTSGGNSGSPLLNDNGELVGINFDRCWEGTMSDIVYDPEMCRNISIDIRYCLFLIDKFAGAGHLVDEMTIIE
ncbi:MAG: S46 family peptidase, partial [Bacteroidales bacterium]|nr:S46 family peptidase [Bacteroidales bacterium]